MSGEKGLEFVQGYLKDEAELLGRIDAGAVAHVMDLCREAVSNDRFVFVFGNGGAAATASHFACDLGKGASLGHKKRFKVLCLNDCIPWMTALSNDISYEDVFVQQLENFAHKDDVVIGISASGNSTNVIKAVSRAGELGCRTVGIVGFKGGRLKEHVEHCVLLPSDSMGLIEDAQLIVLHAVAYALMNDEG